MKTGRPGFPAITTSGRLASACRSAILDAILNGSPSCSSAPICCPGARTRFPSLALEPVCLCHVAMVCHACMIALCLLYGAFGISASGPASPLSGHHIRIMAASAGGVLRQVAYLAAYCIIQPAQGGAAAVFDVLYEGGRVVCSLGVEPIRFKTGLVIGLESWWRVGVVQHSLVAVVRPHTK